MRAAVITVSDSSWQGTREDLSGPALCELVRQQGWELVSFGLLPDEHHLVAEELKRLCDEDLADLVLTTGGTGCSPRDHTPEATLEVSERLVPGIPEAMRLRSLQVTPHAMLSRAVACIRKRTLIINMPGSPKAVRECMEAILPALPHAVRIMRGEGE